MAVEGIPLPPSFFLACFPWVFKGRVLQLLEGWGVGVTQRDHPGS